MEILRSFNQISEKFKNIFNIDVSNVPILDVMSKHDLEILMKDAKVESDSAKEVSGLAELIFQLNEYVPALSNFVKMCIISRNFEAIIYFMEKLFVAHVGNVIYNSKNKEYSHRERFFDRFIEVVKSTDLSVKDILPFMFAIIEDADKTDLSVWLAPALEYMQNVYRENMDIVNEYITNEEGHHLTYLELGLEFNPQRAIMEIFNSTYAQMDEKIISKLLKHYSPTQWLFLIKTLKTVATKNSIT